MKVIINSAMSIDGKISTYSGDSKISSDIDLLRMHKLRSKVDAIIIGIKTAIRDNPMLTVRLPDSQNYYPTRIVIDSLCKIPITSQLVKTAKMYDTIIAVTNHASVRKIRKLESLGVQIINTGKSYKVDLKKLFQILKQRGMKKILIEGGGEINWSCISHNLVNELIITISPIIIGGKNTKTIVEGRGYSKISMCKKFQLVKVSKNRNDEIIIHYRLP